MTTLIARVAAAQATLDHFRDRPFDWGVCDCAILAAYNLRQMGQVTPLRQFGVYRTGPGALRALRRRGFHDLGGVLDQMGLLRIGHASALPGDIVGAPGQDDWGMGLAIHLGNGRYLGFAQDALGARAGVLTIPHITAAWRAI